MNSTFGKRLKQLRLERDITQMDLGKAVNVAYQSVSYYENTGRFPKDVNIINNIARYFDVDVDYLLGNQEERRKVNYDMNSIRRELEKAGYAIVRKEEAESKTKPIPAVVTTTIGKVPHIDYISLDSRFKADMYYIMDNDSMVDFNLPAGSILLFEDLGEVLNGDIGIFRYHDKIYVRKYRTTDQGLQLLIPGNDNEEVIVVTDGALNHLGTLVYVFSGYTW